MPEIANDLSFILRAGTWVLIALAFFARAIGLKRTSAFLALGGLLVVGVHAMYANSFGALVLIIPAFILGVLLIPWRALRN